MAKDTMNSSAVIDMEMEMVGDDESDYGTDFASNGDSGAAKQRTKDEGYMEKMQQEVGTNMASYVWQSGSKKAKETFNVYANIDILRPYFDVEPHEVRARLLRSLIPHKPGGQREKIPRELYGPTMLVFTMIALLLFEMKSSGHAVQEGTLMGTAFGICFGYWFGISGLTWLLSYVCNTHITFLQVFSLLGYALFGHCVVVFMGTVIHTSHDHFFFYMLWAVLGGLSTLRMISILASRTAGQSQKIMLCAILGSIHLLYLLYLHFAYHKIVEELSDVMEHAGIPQMKQSMDETAAKHIDSLVSTKLSANVQLTTKTMQRMIRSNMLEKLKPKESLANVLPNFAENVSQALLNNGTKFLREGIKMLNGTKLE